MAGERSTRALYRVIAWLAERQHGLVTRAQLLEIGLSRHQVDRLLVNGWLHIIHRGVYAVGHRRLTQHGRWLAAVLAMNEGAVLSHRSAAALWGLLPRKPGPIDVSMRANHRAQRGIRVHRVALARHEIRTRDGIPVTNPERTLLDLAATEPRTLDRAIREAHYLRLTSAASLVEICKHHAGRRGSRKLASAIADADTKAGPTHEELERRFRRFLKRHRLPIPKFNAPLDIGGRVIHPDCLWPEQRLIVELDGRAAHATPHAFEADRARDRALQAAGFRVVRITWRQLHEEPEALLMDLRRFLVRCGSTRSIASLP